MNDEEAKICSEREGKAGYDRPYCAGKEEREDAMEIIKEYEKQGMERYCYYCGKMFHVRIGKKEYGCFCSAECFTKNTREKGRERARMGRMHERND